MKPEQFNFEKVKRSKPGFACKGSKRQWRISWSRDACRQALPAAKKASQAKLGIGSASDWSLNGKG